MKIERIETFHFVGPVERPYGPSCAYSYSRDAIIVKITTDDGLVGWGETYALAAARAMIDSELAPKLIGENPLDTRRLWYALWGYNFGHGLAVSALDIALNDLRGKAQGLSLSALHGGALRTRVPAYASGINYFLGLEPEDYWVTEALRLAELGFRAIKMRVGRYPMNREVPLLEQVRKALPDSVALMADGNAAYTIGTAIRMARELDRLRFTWFEEPIREADYEGYEILTAQCQVPIAAGEIHLDRSAMARFVHKHGARIVQPDVSICGGVSELLFMADLARLSRISTVPHCNAAGICLAATVHLCALIPEQTAVLGAENPPVELEMPSPVFHSKLLTKPIWIEADGLITVPTGPGLGIEIDEDVLRFYSSPQ